VGKNAEDADHTGLVDVNESDVFAIEQRSEKWEKNAGDADHTGLVDVNESDVFVIEQRSDRVVGKEG
jgi:hypothetical protein